MISRENHIRRLRKREAKQSRPQRARLLAWLEHRGSRTWTKDGSQWVCACGWRSAIEPPASQFGPFAYQQWLDHARSIPNYQPYYRPPRPVVCSHL